MRIGTTEYTKYTERLEMALLFEAETHEILEIKAAKTIDDSHRAQLMNYLRATGIRVGLLVNFGHYPKAQHERFIL